MNGNAFSPDQLGPYHDDKTNTQRTGCPCSCIHGWRTTDEKTGTVGGTEDVPHRSAGRASACYTHHDESEVHNTMSSRHLDGGRVNRTDDMGRTPLSHAAEEGHADTVRLLLRKGAFVDARDNSMRTALSWAAANGHVKSVSLLIEYGADEDLPDNEGRTPLIWAASNGHQMVVRQLLGEKDLFQNDTNSSPTTKSLENNLAISYKWKRFVGVQFWKAILLKRSLNPIHEDNFARTICVLAPRANETDSLRMCRALFDTGNPLDLVSRYLIERVLKMPVQTYSDGPHNILEMANGTMLCATGTVKLRWYGSSSTGEKKLFFRPKIYETEFFVVDGFDANFDVIIGSSTIRKLRLLVAAGFMGFHSIADSRVFPVPKDMRFTGLNSKDGPQDNIRDIAWNGDLIYEHLDALGKGGFAVVDRVRDRRSGAVLARKTFDVNGGFERAKRSFETEVSILKKLSNSHSPHIVRLVDAFSCLEKKQFYLIMSPVANQGNFRQYLEKLYSTDTCLNHGDQEFLGQAMRDLARGLAFIHGTTIRHKDITPMNILVHNARVMYTDFGVAIDFHDRGTSTTDGSCQQYNYSYAAPEVLEHQPRNRKSDVFSLGCVYFEILARYVDKVDLRGLTVYKDGYAYGSGATVDKLQKIRLYGGIGRLCASMLEKERDRRPDACQVEELVGTHINSRKGKMRLGSMYVNQKHPMEEKKPEVQLTGDGKDTGRLLYPAARDGCEDKVKMLLHAGTDPSVGQLGTALNAIPALFTVPFSRDDQFVGREDVMAEISSKRAPSPNHRRIALVGLGGVGKSHVALEYAYRTRQAEPHTLVLWIDASDPVRFEQGYRDVADKVALPGRENPNSDILQLVNTWLSDTRNGRWLMILDNVDDDSVFFANGVTPHALQTGSVPGNLTSSTRPLERYLPQTPHGVILITSRNRTAAINLVGTHGSIVSVKPMEEADALALLKTRVPFDEDGKADAKALVQALERIPLAITHAAAYVQTRAQTTTLSSYLDMFRTSEANQKRLLSRKEWKDLRDCSTRGAVIATWQISFSQIWDTERLAADLLALMSMFYGQGIPQSLVKGDMDQLDFEDALGPLVSFSLVRAEIGKQSFGMHRLVQLSIRRWLEGDRQLSRWIKESIRVMKTAFPSGDYETWADCQVFLPHSRETMSHVAGDKEDMLNQAEIGSKVGWYLLLRGEYQAAENVERMCVEAREKVLGVEHPDTLTSVSQLGSVLERQGKYEEAEIMHRRALGGREKVPGVEHPDTLTSVSNLASNF